MKNYIYAVKRMEHYVPVITNDNENSGLRLVTGYHLSKLQEFVKSRLDLPQDGYYIETTKEMVDEVTVALNLALNMPPYDFVKDANGVTRLVKLDVDNSNEDDYYDDDDEYFDDGCDSDCDCDCDCDPDEESSHQIELTEEMLEKIISDVLSDFVNKK